MAVATDAIPCRLKASRGRLSLCPPLFWTPDLARGCIVQRIVLVGAEGSAATSVSIGDCNAGGTQRSYPVPPGPAREAAPLILCGVINTIAPLALPRGRKGGSQSQHYFDFLNNAYWVSLF
jgi:hypothetical protein